MRIRLFFVLLSLLVVSAAKADRKMILDYEYGNQITASYVKVFSDGVVQHNERVCCPPKMGMILSPPLSTEDLSRLEENILLAAKGKIVQRTGSPTTYGSSSGSLRVFVNDVPVAIHIVERAATTENGAMNQVMVNSAKEAQAIEAFVLSIVDQKIAD